MEHFKDAGEVFFCDETIEAEKRDFMEELYGILLEIGLRKYYGTTNHGGYKPRN